MRTDYTYIVSIVDEETRESILVTAQGQHELLLILSRMPERQTISSIQNVGITVEGTDYLQQLTDNGDMNFGGH